MKSNYSKVAIWIAIFSICLEGHSAERKRPEINNPKTADGFEQPVRLKVGDKFIDVGDATGHAAPCLIDLYSEGKRALLVGEFGVEEYTGEVSEGKRGEWCQARVRVYRNVGTEQKPRYDKFEYLKAGDNPAAVPNT